MTEGKAHKSTTYEEITGSASHVFQQVKRLIREGVARRMIVYDNEEERVMLDVPLAAGIAGTVLASYSLPVISAIAFYLFGMNDVSIIVERKKEETVEEESEAGQQEGRSIDIKGPDEEGEEG